MRADALARLVAATALPRPQQDPAVSKAKAERILSQPQFQKAKPNIFEQVLKWLADRFGSGSGTLLHGGPGAAVAWVILAICVAAVVLVAVWATRGIQRDPERAEPGPRVEVRRTAADWRAEAEALEARGEWKSALRCRYRGLVAELVARRVVPDLPGRTTGEHRADVGDTLPRASSEFAGASERPTGPEESAQFDQLADHVIATARGRGRGPDGGDDVGHADGEGSDGPGRELVAP
jgi:hypothetical protein